MPFGTILLHPPNLSQREQCDFFNGLLEREKSDSNGDVLLRSPTQNSCNMGHFAAAPLLFVFH